MDAEMLKISWTWVAILAPCGLVMALVSCFIGMKPQVENPAWWGLYLIWIVVTAAFQLDAAPMTLWVSSVIAGALHGGTTATLIDAYQASNPWHAENMKGPKLKWRLQFLLVGPVIGFVFGAIVASMSWAVGRYVI